MERQQMILDGPADGPAVVLAHGLRYDPPPLPGIDDLWGRSVFHCAFCDGWEVRDLQLALVDGLLSSIDRPGWFGEAVQRLFVRWRFY